MARISLVALALALVVVASNLSEARSLKSEEQSSRMIKSTRLPLYSQIRESGGVLDYYVEMAIGTPPQHIRVKIDTIGFDFWVISSKCTKDECKNRRKYESRRSSSYKKDGRRSGSRSSGMSGFLSSETLRIGSITLPNVTFGEATDPGANFKGANYDAVMGVNFMQPEHGEADNVMTKLARSGLMEQTQVFFHIYENFTDFGQIGEVGFGVYDMTDTYGFGVAVPTGRDGYSVQLSSVFVGNTTICRDRELGVINWSDRLVVPYKDAVELNKALGAIEDPNPTGSSEHNWSFADCDHDSHPVVFIDIAATKLFIEPKVYMAESPDGRCRSIFTGAENERLWRVNYKFMSAIFVSFDHTDKLLVFGQKLPL